jgi:hypothetical protein
VDTKTLITQAKARFKHQEAKLYLQEKYSNRLTLVSQNGLWKITPEFLSMLRASPGTLILIDQYDNPVRVDTVLLLETAQELYDTVMSNWLQEWSELEKTR